jgi:hypothetical protein
MRRWLVGAGLAMTVVLVGVSALAAVNAMARRTVNEKSTYGFKGKAVSIELTVGEVKILPGTIDDQILVSRTLTYGLRRPFVEERIDGDIFKVRDGDCAMPVGAICHVKWLLQVPPDVHLSIATESGDISVFPGMTGAVNLTSDSGDVSARGLTGPSVQLLSHHGKVSGTGLRSTHVVATSDTDDISLTFRTPPKFVLGKTIDGSVEVVLPDGNETYKISATSPGGRTLAAKHDANSKLKVTVESKKGPVTVRDVSATAEEEDQTSGPPGP